MTFEIIPSSISQFYMSFNDHESEILSGAFKLHNERLIEVGLGDQIELIDADIANWQESVDEPISFNTDNPRKIGSILLIFFTHQLELLDNEPMAIFTNELVVRTFVLTEELHNEIRVGNFALQLMDLPETPDRL